MGLKKFFVKEESNNEAESFKTKNSPPLKTVVSKDMPQIQSIQGIGGITDSNSVVANNMTSTTEGGKSVFVKFFHDQISNSPAMGHYLEFIGALKDVESLATDEKTKFTMIYASFKAQKISVDELIAAAKKYQELCTQKKNELDNGYQQGVAQRDQSIKGLVDDNSKIDNQMQELNTRKLQNSEKMKTVADEKSSLDRKKSDYTAAYGDVNADIQSNIDKIAQHLGATTVSANQ